MEKSKNLVEIKEQINKLVGDNETFNSLVATTFKGLEPNLVKRAILEGMMRGFKFDDFLEKNVYAIPFRVKGAPSYNLVTSIDYARKLGSRSGIVGKSAPDFDEDTEGNILCCTVTVKKKIDETVGEFTATVFFDEYTTKERLWLSKPRTMIAKVAEMHALRMACPEELAKSYLEEEFENENKVVETQPEFDVEPYRKLLSATQNLEELKKVWADFPIQAKEGLEELKTELKQKYESN